MSRSIKLMMLMFVLSLTLTLGGCETVSSFFGKASPPAVIAPSTYCQAYKPIQAPYPRNTLEFELWWDQLETHLGPEMGPRLRGNNEAYRVNCLEDE